MRAWCIEFRFKFFYTYFNGCSAIALCFFYQILIILRKIRFQLWSIYTMSGSDDGISTPGNPQSEALNNRTATYREMLLTCVFGRRNAYYHVKIIKYQHRTHL